MTHAVSKTGLNLQTQAQLAQAALSWGAMLLSCAGLLDQGLWPDGLYTAPSEDALAFDIELAKQAGFNMLRKHVKVEPDVW